MGFEAPTSGESGQSDKPKEKALFQILEAPFAFAGSVVEGAAQEIAKAVDGASSVEDSPTKGAVENTEVKQGG